jgi:hypothetical protein
MSTLSPIKVVGGALLGLALLCQAALGWLHSQSFDHLISLFHIQPSYPLTASGVLVQRLHVWEWSLRIVALHCALIAAFLVDRPIRIVAVVLFVLLALLAAFTAFAEATIPNMFGPKSR